MLFMVKKFILCFLSGSFQDLNHSSSLPRQGKLNNYFNLYLVIATAAKRKEIDANWKWLEQHLLPTLGNGR
jgi:hypothetical protein